MKTPNHDITAIVSTITSKYIERITIGFANLVTDERLQLVIASKIWEKFDDAIARLAERSLNNGRKLQLDFHVCGCPSVELFHQIVPRFVKTGRLEVVKTSYIWAGSTLHRPLGQRSHCFLPGTFETTPIG